MVPTGKDQLCSLLSVQIHQANCTDLCQETGLAQHGAQLSTALWANISMARSCPAAMYLPVYTLKQVPQAEQQLVREYMNGHCHDRLLHPRSQEQTSPLSKLQHWSVQPRASDHHLHSAKHQPWQQRGQPHASNIMCPQAHQVVTNCTVSALAVCALSTAFFDTCSAKLLYMCLPKLRKLCCCCSSRTW